MHDILLHKQYFSVSQHFDIIKVFTQGSSHLKNGTELRKTRELSICSLLRASCLALEINEFRCYEATCLLQPDFNNFG